VIGIDINPDYLHTVFTRYNHKINFLELLNLDIVKNSESICKADFIWAALILEYTGIEKLLEFSANNIRRDGHHHTPLTEPSGNV
jgi:hypothetical protein